MNGSTLVATEHDLEVGSLEGEHLVDGSKQEAERSTAKGFGET